MIGFIGEWACRVQDDREGNARLVGRAHFIESSRGDPERLIAYCGKEMAVEHPRGSMLADDWNDSRKCKVCLQRKEPAATM